MRMEPFENPLRDAFGSKDFKRLDEEHRNRSNFWFSLAYGLILLASIVMAIDGLIQVHKLSMELQNLKQEIQSSQARASLRKTENESSLASCTNMTLSPATIGMVLNVTKEIVDFVKSEEMSQSLALNKTASFFKEYLNYSIAERNAMVEQLQMELDNLRKELIASLDSKWFVPYNGFQYQVVLTRQTWQASRNICTSRGGDLATQGMRDYATRKVIANSFTNQNLRTWIGLHDLNEEGFYQWIDGVNATKENTFWKPGEPSRRNRAERDCGQILPNHRQYTTDDEICTAKRQALCEKKII